MRTAIISAEGGDRQCGAFWEIGQCQLCMWTLKWYPIRWVCCCCIIVGGSQWRGYRPQLPKFGCYWSVIQIAWKFIFLGSTPQRMRFWSICPLYLCPHLQELLPSSLSALGKLTSLLLMEHAGMFLPLALCSFCSLNLECSSSRCPSLPSFTFAQLSIQWSFNYSACLKLPLPAA